MKRPRDSQRSKVYRSEDTLIGVPPVPEFRTVGECEWFVGRALATEAWQVHGSRFPTVEVRDGRGRRSAAGCPTEGAIWLPRALRHRLIICHELAHVCTSPELAGHGPEFCRTYLSLVIDSIGADLGEALETAFRAHKVRIA